MTVDTVVKIIESEKCALDMSSYEDLHSPPVSENVGGNVSGNGDSKDDYVFVNDSDVALLDDHTENHSKLSVEGDDSVEVNGDVVLSVDHVENQESREASEAKLSVEEDDSVEVNGDVVLSVDHVENQESREASEAKLSVEGDDGVEVDGDVVLSDDHVENRENREASEAKLSVEGDDGVEVDGDVVLSNDDVENQEDKEVNEGELSVVGDGDVKVNGDVVSADEHVENDKIQEVDEAKLSMEGDGDVKGDDVLSDDHVENLENKEVNEAKLSVEGDESAEANGEVVVSDDHVENHENKEVNEAKLSVEGDGDVKVNGNVVSSDDHVENDVNQEVNEVNLSVEGDGDVKVNNGVVLSGDHVKNHENEEVNEAKLSVERDDNVKTNCGAESDRLENEVKVYGDVLEVENMVSVEEEVEGGGSLVRNGEINSENKVVDVENGVSGVNEGSELEPVVDEVKEGVIPEHVVDEVKEIDDPNPVVDDVKDESVPEHVVDEVKESNDPKPIVDEVKEVESVFEYGDNGNVSVDSIDSRSLDGYDNSKISVSDAQESAEVEAEDNTAVNGVLDALETSEVEGSVPEPVVDKVREGSDPKSVVGEVESIYETGNNDNATIGSTGSRSLDVGDNNTHTDFDTQESAEVESEESTAVNGVLDALESAEVAQINAATVDIPESELEEQHIVPPLGNGIEFQGGTSEKAEEDQTWKLKVTENNGDVHTVLEPADCLVVEPEHLEADVNDQSVEGGLADAQSLDTDVRASLPLDVEGKGLPLDNANATPVEDSSDFQQQNIPSADGENKKRDLIEVEAKTDEQGDVVDPVAAGGSQESADSVAIGGELDQCQKGKNTDQTSLDSLPKQSEGAWNQDNFELDAPEMEDPVSIIAGQSDGRKIESAAGVEDNSGALTAMQFDTTDKPSLEDELERVDGDGESEVITETDGIQEASPKEGALQDQVAEQTLSFDVVDKEISSVDRSLEKNSKFEDATNFPKLQSEDDTTVNLDQNDQGGSYARDNVAENKDAPASEQSSEDAGNGLRSDSSNSVAELPPPSDSDNLKEQGVVGNDISAADSDSAYDASSQANLEHNNVSGPCLVHDTKSETETVNSETDVAIKSNIIFNGTLRPEISFGSFGSGSPLSYSDINCRSDVLNKHSALSTGNDEAVLTSPANGDHSDGLNHDTACSEQIEVSASSVEGSEADSSDAQNINPDLRRKPYYYLVKVPRFDEEKYKDQLRQSEIELAEKTKTRDACQAEFNKQQAYCRELRSDLEAANLEVRAARELVRGKSRELDSAHSLINLARHGVSVEDLDNKIHHLEHRMQHQTLNNLREEKELVREIKQLNLQRQKLTADPERLQAIQQARTQRDQTEEQLKVLKKELNALKDNLARADEHLRAAKKKHDDESVLLNDLKQQLKSANDIRQEAFIHLIALKKQLNEKNTPFFKAKNDLRVAYNYANAGNIDSLEHHCVNQVEKIMEMWNKNDEFRNEYIQSNMRRTLYKFGTPDGTCLGIDEVPPSLGDVSDRKVNTSAKANSFTEILTREIDSPEEPKPTEDKMLKKVEQNKAAPVKMIEAISKNNLAKASGIIEIEEDTEKPKLTIEEEELARKAEQLRREEEAARLMEQRRLEEKAKAEEALERKRRNAMKAQARAEFKARKEAEEKEKEREKRAKKKGKKRGINVEITENEPAQPSKPSSESVKEPEVTEKLATKAKRPQKVSLHSKQMKTTKPIPPALRNKGKRGLLRYWPYAFIVLLAIALFYLGSYERIQTIRQHISALLHW